MTVKEAKAILEKNDLLNPWTDEQGRTWHYQVSDYYKEFTNSFGFAVYPYNNKEPIDPDWVRLYSVDKNTKKVSESSTPLDGAEVKKYMKVITEK